MLLPGRWVRDETSVWYGGVTTPDPDLGEPGSYYIDYDGNVYRKQATGWQFEFRIKGTIWDAGTGAPTAAIGLPGDFYVQDSNGTFWRKSAGGVWLLSGSIRVDWFDALADPVPSAGKVGDYHLNRNSGILFRKTNLGWDQRAQLQGAAGNRIFPTVGTPSVATGNDDDWAIDPGTGDLFLKSGGAWGIVGNIKGPQGSQGPQGPPGGGGGGGGSPASETIYPFILLEDLYTQPYYSGAGNPVWRGLYYENGNGTTGQFGLAVVDDQGNIQRFVSKTTPNYWEKGQRLTVVDLYGSYNSVDNTWDFLIDPDLGNYFNVICDYGTLNQRILIEPTAYIQPGHNISIRVLKQNFGEMTFGPQFKFAGGPLGPLPLTGTKSFAITGIAFTSDLSCTVGADFE